MAEPQPRNVKEGATTAGDVEEEVTKAKSAEDRKAAAALASMDSNGDGSSAADVDIAAASKAVRNLGTAAPAPGEKKEVKKIKIDPAEVQIIVSFNLPWGEITFLREGEGEGSFRFSACSCSLWARYGIV